jgi:hypothetical protein
LRSLGFDTLYGRSGWLRAQLRNAGALYMAEVPVDTELYLEKPLLGIKLGISATVVVKQSRLH